MWMDAEHGERGVHLLTLRTRAGGGEVFGLLGPPQRAASLKLHALHCEKSSAGERGGTGGAERRGVWKSGSRVCA